MAAELDKCLLRLESLDSSKMLLGLDRMARMVREHGIADYFANTAVIEVAGTNGKGSCASFVNKCLGYCGLLAGLYTSPHLINFTERYLINDKRIDPALLAWCLDESFKVSKKLGIELSYFEHATYAAFLAFKKESVAAAVMEIGLGGRLDAVNAIDADLCIIPSIGLDHMKILGSTIEEIAKEKAAVIKDNSIVVTGRIEPAAMRIIKQRVTKTCSTLFCPDEGYTINCSGEGSSRVYTFKSEHLCFSFRDFAIPTPCLGPALMAASCLKKMLCPNLDESMVKKALTSAALPCRMEEHQIGGTTVVLDVAHNVPAALNLQASLKERFGDGDKGCIAAVIGMLDDKDIEGVIAIMAPLFARFYIAGLDCSRGAEVTRLEKALFGAGVKKERIKSYNKVISAFKAALAEGEGKVAVFGSFYTAGAVKELLDQKA